MRLDHLSKVNYEIKKISQLRVLLWQEPFPSNLCSLTLGDSDVLRAVIVIAVTQSTFDYSDCVMNTIIYYHLYTK